MGAVKETIQSMQQLFRSKRFRYGFLAAFLVAVLFFFLWPLSFPTLNEDVPNITVIRMDASLNVETANKVFPRGSPEYEQVQQILSKYSYHRSILTYFADAFLKRNEGGYWIYLYLGKQGNIICSGTGSVMLNQRVYRMGLLGGGKSRSMMAEIQQLLGP